MIHEAESTFSSHSSPQKQFHVVVSMEEGFRGAPVTATAPGWDEPHHPRPQLHLTPGQQPLL